MGQDFTKGLNVCIGNYGYYNEGNPAEVAVVSIEMKPHETSSLRIL